MSKKSDEIFWEKWISLKKGEEVPLLNFEGGPRVPFLNSEGGPGVPLLNFEGDPGFQGPRVPGSWSHFYTMPVAKSGRRQRCHGICYRIWEKCRYADIFD